MWNYNCGGSSNMHTAGRAVEDVKEKGGEEKREKAALMKSPGEAWLLDVCTLCLLARLWYWFPLRWHQGDHDNSVGLGGEGGWRRCWAPPLRWLLLWQKLRLQHLKKNFNLIPFHHPGLSACHPQRASVSHFTGYNLFFGYSYFSFLVLGPQNITFNWHFHLFGII